MPHIPASSARTHTLHGVTFSAFVGSARGAASLAAWRADFAPATPGQAHTMSAEEVLLVLDGVLEIEIDAESFTAGTGDAVLVPAGAVFRVSTPAESGASAWVTTELGMTARMVDAEESFAPPWAQ